MRPLSPSGTGASPLSGDDVGDARIDHPLNLVLQHQFAPLQARKLQLIPDRLGTEELDSVVELAVLSLQGFEHALRMIVIHFDRFYSIAARAETAPRSACAPPNREKARDNATDSWFITRW